MDSRSVLWYAARPDEPIGHLPYEFRMRIIRSRYRIWFYGLRHNPLTLV